VLFDSAAQGVCKTNWLLKTLLFKSSASKKKSQKPKSERNMLSWKLATLES
jgi:hypothetical protein